METRDLIIETVQKLLIEKGYYSLKIADICKEAGLGKGTFYYHFEHKGQLIDIIGMRMINAMEYEINYLDDKKETEEIIRDLFNVFINFTVGKSVLINRLIEASSESAVMNGVRTGYKPFRKIIAMKLFNDESEVSVFKAKMILGIIDFYIKEDILENDCSSNGKVLASYITMITDGINGISNQHFQE
ncbi:TetR/AcrR family transcriptional regulator [Staphylococcus equorum]|uniref:TetR/AcrR family transcriptional regulator n=1 Tax=Staphylococcus equorum TaxID=246432 RepID=UPI00130052FD|nr:TetR/AcrR family transcriptional regulator [Staphylococcus equorum]